MNRGITLVGASLLLSAGFGPRALSRATGAATSSVVRKRRAKQAPKFEVDPMWPKPMPNRWILGSAVGRRGRFARPHLRRQPDRQLHRAHRDRREREPADRRVLLPGAERARVRRERARSSATGAAPARATIGRRRTHGLAIDPEGNVWIGGARRQRFENSQVLATTASSSRSSARRRRRSRRRRRRRAAPDTAYAGVSPGRGAAVAVAAAADAAVAASARRHFPANSSSMDSFGGASGFSFDAQGERSVRRRRLSQSPRRGGRHDDRRDQALLGRVRQQAGRRRHGQVRRRAARRQSSSAHRCAARRSSNDGMVYVCDTHERSHSGLQEGRLVREGKDRSRPTTLGSGSVWDIAFSRDPQQKYLYVADGMNMKVHILDRQSLEELTAFGDGGRQPGQFYAVHSVATDSKGNLYTTETLRGQSACRSSTTRA